jgi:hypothetical protein
VWKRELQRPTNSKIDLEVRCDTWGWIQLVRVASSSWIWYWSDGVLIEVKLLINRAITGLWVKTLFNYSTYIFVLFFSKLFKFPCPFHNLSYGNWRWKQHLHSSLCYLSTKVHGVTSQKILFRGEEDTKNICIPSGSQDSLSYRR